MSEAIYTGNGFKHKTFEGCINMRHYKDQLEKLLANVNAEGFVDTLISPTQNDKTKYYEKINTYIAKDGQKKEERAEQERQSRQPNDPLPDIPLDGYGKPSTDPSDKFPF
ncbi:MAG: hypothetical protein IMZ53_00435 [Thermoplasmata archaeon]|nr:hypothetical protein [Thermoplasmata archaeon]